MTKPILNKYFNHHLFFDKNKKKLIDLNDNDLGKIKKKKILPGKKIKSVEVLVRITNDK
ncbi:MAG: hypothetical protein CM1200mP13_17420 [Candidatus Pelagibacterales bacterium]|nr:MAG: hypothetical protein CM1200mP13_17420 [Pelagibacterales bacterium]